MTLHVQLMTMIVMVVGGVYLGFAFDTYRRLTVSMRKHTLLKYILEMGFWLLQTGALFYALFWVNEGEIRFYVFLACLLGYSMYVVLFRKGFQFVLERIIRIVNTVFMWILEVIHVLLIQPVIWVLKVFYMLLRGTIILSMRVLVYPFNLLIKLFTRILPDTFLEKVSQFIAFCSTIINRQAMFLKRIFKKWR